MPPRNKAHPGPPPSIDHRLEKKLKDLGLLPQTTLMVDVGLHEFDEEGSLHNQARIGEELDKGHVAVLADKLRDDITLPAIVAHEKDAKEPLFIIDGNHRFQAHKDAGRGGIDVYVIKGNDPDTRRKVELLMYQLNAEHGKATDEATRVQHALNLHDRNGTSLKNAAKAVSVPANKVEEAYKLREASERADRVRINRGKFDRLPPSQRKRINQLRTDEVFKGMAQLAIDAHLKNEQLASAMATLTAISSHEGQMKQLDSLRAAYSGDIALGKEDEQPHGRGKMAPKTHVLITLGRVDSLTRTVSPQVLAERLSPEDREDLKRKMKESMDVLTTFYEALDAK